MIQHNALRQPPLSPDAATTHFVPAKRHHYRAHSGPRKVKETLDASTTFASGSPRINQYEIKQELGRGFFGAVHLAVDVVTGQEYAIKEYSKSCLRRRSQTAMLRRRARTPGMFARHHKLPPDHQEDSGGSLNLVRKELAIMKKLNHENIVRLIEVLDNPSGSSIYMVLEYCAVGPPMKISVDNNISPIINKANPEYRVECGVTYAGMDIEQCRLYFRDLVLGIEYLHAHGIVHRDIKTDNLLVTEENVLKIADFGESEVFDKDNDFFVTNFVGSPAFTAPELAYLGSSASHNRSGKAADIWSMGVVLYCFAFGKLPFVRENVWDLYDSIQHDELICPSHADPVLIDLIYKILERDPTKRIRMPELREHPWITLDGYDLLLSYEENVSDLFESAQLTQADIDQAFEGVRKNRFKLQRPPSSRLATYSYSASASANTSTEDLHNHSAPVSGLSSPIPTLLSHSGGSMESSSSSGTNSTTPGNHAGHTFSLSTSPTPRSGSPHQSYPLDLRSPSEYPPTNQGPSDSKQASNDPTDGMRDQLSSLLV